MGIGIRRIATESDWRSETLRTNLWLIPAVESLAAVAIFAGTLTIDRAAYRGAVTGNVFPCGSGSSAFPVRSTAKIQLSVITARVDNGAWIASSWAGTMVVNSPYTASGSLYCPAFQRTATLSGSP